MLNAAAGILRSFARGGGATASLSRRAQYCPSSSYLLTSPQHFSTNNCNDNHHAPSSPVTPSALVGYRSTSSAWPSGMGANNTFRWFSSKSSDAEDTPSSASPSAAENENETISGSSQHDTWVQFQRSISVKGFDTGQTVKERNLNKSKRRGGKMDRKRKEREMELERALKGIDDSTQLKGGEFPALRYSDEETERLLAEAYAAIPPRAGKRGTLNLKREKRRWWIKRQYDAKKKHERIATHHRRLAKWKGTWEEIKRVQEGAGDVRMREEEYRLGVLKRWAVINGHAVDDAAVGGEGEEVVMEKKAIEA